MSTQYAAIEQVDVHHLRMLAAIGCCVSRRRKLAGWSQKELARRSRLSASEIQHVEHARRGLAIDTVLRICLAFGITMVELMAEVDRVMNEWDRLRR